ncbi:TniQ family protein [Nitrospirillum sp. BR 11752]|uniref:TniQ family protein n=1 Tax=Nitrospirillum sp. BR 11752 TaxID=3104293 RepID=UPI002EB578CD|nr:TniQ family protein [Nitrospirillum sp. BR 11752]
MFKLIFPLVPYADEGFLGFVARSAEENFRPTPWAVLTYVAPRLMAARAFMLSDTDMEPLRRLLSMTPAELERMSYRAADTRHVRLLGHTLPKELVSLIWRKCCPLCLAEAPYHRAVWDFVFMVACPHHNVMLVDRCAECRGPLNWLTSKLTHCVHCGADYRLIDPEPAPDDIEGLRAVVSLLEGKPPPEGLAGMDVGCLLKTIYMLGQCVHDTLLNVAAVKIGRHHPERVLAYLNIGWQACADWPHSFYRHIDWLRQGAADRQDQHERMYRDIGVTAKWILKQDKDPAFGPITSTFSRYIAGDVRLVTKARAVVRARRANPSRSFFLPQEAIRLLGTSMPRLMRLAEERDMFLVRGRAKATAPGSTPRSSWTSKLRSRNSSTERQPGRCWQSMTGFLGKWRMPVFSPWRPNRSPPHSLSTRFSRRKFRISWTPSTAWNLRSCRRRWANTVSVSAAPPSQGVIDGHACRSA